MSKVKAFINFLIEKVKRSMERFPITLLFTLGFVMVSILLNHLDYGSQWNDQRELYGRMLMALALGIPVTALLKLVVEKWTLDKTAGYLIQGFGQLRTSSSSPMPCM